MGAELAALLVEATLAGSFALVLVLALRLPLRALLGASAAYALWLCVPVALLAVLLPRGAEAPLALSVVMPLDPAMTVVAAASPQPAWDWRSVLALAWLLGVLASSMLLVRQQQRFRRALGLLHLRADGLYQAETATAGLPAVTGVFLPKILLPSDFERRYTAEEQALVVQHERLHVRRGDLLVNALASVFRCLFWFNPLFPFALRRFRMDQELACDERVVARNPRSRRQYGEAMLKTHLADLPLPVGCHWQAFQPLKERIDMLKRPSPTARHWLASTFIALALSATAGYTAWATQPAQAGGEIGTGTTASVQAYAIDMRLDVDGDESRFQVREQAGRTFSIKSDTKGSPRWEADFSLKPLPDPGTLAIMGVVRAGGELVSQPALTITAGRAATIQLSTPNGGSVFTLEFTVKPLVDGAQPAPAVASASTPEQPAMVAKRMPPPVYPNEALRQGHSGQVVAVVDVDAQGAPTGVRIERSEPAGVFDAATIAAIRQWRFKPAMENGRAVASSIRIPVDFESGMTPVQMPAEVQDGSDYHWFVLQSAENMKAVCDVLRMDPADAQAPIYCGIRKQLAGL